MTTWRHGLVKLTAVVWVVGCVGITMVRMGASDPGLLNPTTRIHPNQTAEPLLAPAFDWKAQIYYDAESWKKAHSEWEAQLVPAVWSARYWSEVGLLIVLLGVWSAVAWTTSSLIARMSLHITSEGIRRLAMMGGTIGTVAWVIYGASNGFDFAPRGWVVFWVGVPVTFALGFGTIWAVDWTIAGFRE